MIIEVTVVQNVEYRYLDAFGNTIRTLTRPLNRQTEPVISHVLDNLPEGMTQVEARIRNTDGEMASCTFEAIRQGKNIIIPGSFIVKNILKIIF